MGADFSGYATKAGLKCSDGLVIMPDAFKDQDKMQVPLVFQHGHHDVENVLGYAQLENRPDGVYCHGYFNDTPKGQAAKKQVQHGDITSLSIYANKLVKKANQVFHGAIREVSLVLAGANPGAKIDFVQLQHSDGTLEDLDEEAVITTGLEFQHADSSDDSEESDDDGETLEDIYQSMTDEQKNVVHYMLAAALKESSDDAEHSENDEEDNENQNEDTEGDSADGDNTDEGDLNHQEGNEMTRNVFEKNGESSTESKDERRYLSHSEIEEIKTNWKSQGSMKQAVETFALKHGIENLELLFPDPKLVGSVEFDKRRTEWVSGVLNGTKKSPFARIKTMLADLTHDEARAKGYIKGNLKKEEFFGLTKRTTGPTTVYKKQKLDRDDIIDATELDVVAWMKAEMRMMLEEELARAILIGDGRDVADEDKIKDPEGATDGLGIRSILHDHELYAVQVNVNLDDANSSYQEVVEEVMLAMEHYKGSGSPTFYTTQRTLTRMLLTKDTLGRRLWRTSSDLAAEMGVGSIVPVEVFEDESDLVGIIVNLSDYNVGTDKGGEVTLFDDFDIDYNQYKYLIETRFSGALVKIRSALVIKKTAAGNVLVTPVEPTFDGTNVVIPTVTGVNYTIDGVAVADGSTNPVANGATVVVKAVPEAGYYFATSEDDEWTYTNPA